MRTRPHLPSLTGLRWFAALAVFFHHSAFAWNWNQTVTAGYSELARPGSTGVTFFYMLSGFVLAWSPPDRDTPRPFYRRRFARIAPAYWVATLIAIVVYV